MGVIKMTQPSVVGNLSDWQTIHSYMQWEIQVHNDGGYWRIVNLGKNGDEQFYVTAPRGVYGAPHKYKDPFWALSIPSECSYVDGNGKTVKPAQLIGGVIVKDMEGVVVERLSLSNPEKREPNWVLEDDGKLLYRGQAYFLRTLYMENKHETSNYIGYFHPTPLEGGTVRVLEPEDLPL